MSLIYYYVAITYLLVAATFNLGFAKPVDDRMYYYGDDDGADEYYYYFYDYYPTATADVSFTTPKVGRTRPGTWIRRTTRPTAVPATSRFGRRRTRTYRPMPTTASL